VSAQSVWRVALHDILDVKPIPRLRFALAAMSSEQLRDACVRLAAQERLFTSPSPRPLQVVFEHDASRHSAPVSVPGGNHFVTISSCRRQLVLYASVNLGYEEVGFLIPESKSRIDGWKMVAISSDEVMILIVNVDDMGE
jgi:hypothetical protein